MAGIGNAIELNFEHAVGVLLVGLSLQSVTFPLRSICRKWAKILSVLNPFQYKTEKGVNCNLVPLMFLEPCIRGLCGFSYTDSCIFKMVSVCPVSFKAVPWENPSNVRNWKSSFWVSTSSRQRPSLHLHSVWGNGVCSSLWTVPAVILSVINSMYNNTNNKRWKLVETKDGDLP